MIRQFEYTKTEAHLHEMAVTAEMVKTEVSWHKETLDSFTSLDQFYTEYMTGSVGDELARATAGINGGPALRILDMGAGRGESTFYLSSFGHEVFPVEPSLPFCEVIEHMARNFGKDLTIYNCSAEDLDLGGERFDAVVFNCSLHHCDDPVRALSQAYRHLKQGGRLFVIGEQFLPFFKSRESWWKQLNEHADESGHYGGNEHIYPYREYVEMIRKAGFQGLDSELVQRYRSKEAIANNLAGDLHRSKLRWLVKSAWLYLVYSLITARLKPATAALQHLSVVQSTFASTK